MTPRFTPTDHEAGRIFLVDSTGKDDYWYLKRHTQVKHDILSTYLERWASTLSGGRARARVALHYVDGFAGRGKYREGEPGSPLIAMQIGQRLHEYRSGNLNLSCYNVEQDLQHFQSLKREVDTARSQFPSVWVETFYGPFHAPRAQSTACSTYCCRRTGRSRRPTRLEVPLRRC